MQDDYKWRKYIANHGHCDFCGGKRDYTNCRMTSDDFIACRTCYNLKKEMTVKEFKNLIRKHLKRLEWIHMPEFYRIPKRFGAVTHNKYFRFYFERKITKEKVKLNKKIKGSI